MIFAHINGKNPFHSICLQGFLDNISHGEAQQPLVFLRIPHCKGSKLVYPEDSYRYSLLRQFNAELAAIVADFRNG